MHFTLKCTVLLPDSRVSELGVLGVVRRESFQQVWFAVAVVAACESCSRQIPHQFTNI